jgi:tRNA nucleotidyltransferase (CCA-adding enzyme)
MKTYVVGGAVRDALLGLPVQDHDHVVVGGTPEEMVARGFTPVGKDFPVFLHPKTHEEYALARTERKTAPGYKGFVFHTDASVTLEEDLIRRDLTINAMARAEDGTLVDPFGGQRDLRDRIFRHVSPAFAEDPVRILRLARFAARFTDFSVAPETSALMRQMVADGEVDALVPERVWQELARGMMEAQPSRMFALLRACGALGRILPELDALWTLPQRDAQPAQEPVGEHVMQAIDRAAHDAFPLPLRCAVLMLHFGAATEGMRPGQTVHHGAALAEQACKRLKIPNDCRDLAKMAAREHTAIDQVGNLDADSIVTMLERCDAFRKPERFLDMLRVTECHFRSRSGNERRPYPPGAYLTVALEKASSVDAGAVARLHVSNPKQIPAAVHAARVAAIPALLSPSEETD